MMEKSVKDGAGDHAVVIEDRRPSFEMAIGGQDNRASFVAMGYDLKKQVGPVVVNGEITELVDGKN